MSNFRTGLAIGGNSDGEWYPDDTEAVSVDFWVLDTLTTENALQMLCACYAAGAGQ